MVSRTLKLFNTYKPIIDANDHLIIETMLLVQKTDWLQNSTLRETIEKNIRVLRSAHLKDDDRSWYTQNKNFNRIDTLYQRLQELPEGQKKGISYKQTALTFFKLNKTTESIRRISATAYEWADIAEFRERMAKAKVANIPLERQKLAKHCSDLWSGICGQFSQTNIPIYVASESDGTIQGLAVADVTIKDEKKVTHLKFLGTKPENIQIFGHEQSIVPRVGSGLVHHIVQGILLDPEYEKKMNLVSSESATGFYKKLGFVMRDEYQFELNEEGMIKLCSTFNQLKI